MQPNANRGRVAVIFDVDGVLTATARVHREAWSTMFNEYLRQQQHDASATVEPFSEADYLQYVDGKPRYQGADAFLRARGIELPWGSPDDRAGTPTVCGLGNRKNELFTELLAQRSVEVFDDAKACVRRLREAGHPVASATASKNGPHVLQAAGLSDLFDQRVDGNTVEQLGLQHKRDLFTEAARRLGAPVPDSCVVEDARHGVQEAGAAGFGLVVGIDRHGDGQDLTEAGADVVVSSLQRFDPMDIPPSALQRFDGLVSRMGGRRPALFLDYDGTLSPIVNDPAAAVLSDGMRRIMQTLADRCPVAVVSGRDRADVQRRVDLPQLFYAGSHGFDIEGPNHRHQLEEARQALPQLDEIERALVRGTAELDGVLVERKRFAIAVHYRRASASDTEALDSIVRDIVEPQPGIRMRGGKKIYEIQPDVAWDKGRAVQYLWNQLGLDEKTHVPMYIGDDTTDEDAFAALGDRGISIRVGVPAQGTRATWRLRSPAEVSTLLQRLADHLART